MIGKGKEHVRLCLLESTFQQFQKQCMEHKLVSDSFIVDMKDSLKEIIEHMDAAREENRESIGLLRDDIKGVMGREQKYITDIQLRDELTAARGSILKDIENVRVRSTKEILTYILLGSTIVGLFGWVYVNIIKTDQVQQVRVIERVLEKPRAQEHLPGEMRYDTSA